MKISYLLPTSIIIFAVLLFGCQDKSSDKMNVKSSEAISTGALAGSTPVNFNAELLFSTKRISDPQISPDGKWVLYSLKTPDIAGNKFYNTIGIVSIDGKENKLLTNDKSNDYNAIWSPDGLKIAFISDREDGVSQAFTMDINGGNLRQITKVENGVDNLLFSPDGKYLSFTSDVKIAPTTAELFPKYPEANVRIYDQLPVRHWNTWEDNMVSHLFIVSVSDGKVKDLNEGEKFDTPMKPFGGREQFSWSPDSKFIAYASKKYTGLEYVKNTNSDIYVVNIGTNATENITEGMKGYDLEPLFSPDGKWLAFNSMERAGFESDKHRIMLYNRETKAISELTKTLDQWASNAVWANDSKSIYFVATDNGKEHILNIKVEDGSWKNITNGWFNDGPITISSNGTIVFGREDMMHPQDIFKITPASPEPVRITSINEDLYNKIKKVVIKERFVTSRDGKQIHTWVVYPPDFDSTKQYPMISFLQGGPQSMIGQTFHYRWNYYLMASHNYIVLLPNRRGVPGFGQQWNDAISKDWGGKPMDDIVDATNDLAKEPYVDKEGLCAVGASAGGYAAFWFAGHNECNFKCLIAHCGVFNFESMYGSTEELWFPDWENGGPYWDPANKAYYDKHSPHRYVQNWKTPIMISTGENDFRVPYTQSLEAFTAAQAHGVPSKLLVFPEETHFILKPQNFLAWSQEFFDWLDKWTKAKK